MKNNALIFGLLATTTLTTSAFAQEAMTYETCTNCSSCGTNCKYNIVNGALTVYGPTVAGTGGTLPEGSVSDYKFSDNTNITSINIQGNITNVGYNSFAYMSNVNSLTIGDSVKTIGFGAFQYMTALQGDLVLPSSVTTISTNAFYNVNHVTGLSLPDSLTTIGDSAFSNMSSITNLTLPNSLTTIGEFAFDSMRGLTGTLIVPDSVTQIGYKAFNEPYSTGLTSVIIGKNVTSIGDHAFNYLNENTIVFCPENMMTACEHAKGTNGRIQSYTKDDNGVYQIGDVYYASANNMSKDVSCTMQGTARYCTFSSLNSTNACTSYEQCLQKVGEYKDAEAAQMAQNGILCQTKQGCLNLMNLVASSTQCKAGEANSIANCSAAVRNGTITTVNLAAADTTGTGITSSGQTGGKRIYTVEEARQAVEAAGTETVKFRIRYK